jgi:hypothetical protein
MITSRTPSFGCHDKEACPHDPNSVRNAAVKKPNQSRQPTPGDRPIASRASLAWRGCSALGHFARMSKITLQDLEDMFANMRAKTKWDVVGDMLWGDFFTEPDPKKLEPVAEHLSRNGYRVVSI